MAVWPYDIWKKTEALPLPTYYITATRCGNNDHIIHHGLTECLYYAISVRCNFFTLYQGLATCGPAMLWELVSARKANIFWYWGEHWLKVYIHYLSIRVNNHKENILTKQIKCCRYLPVKLHSCYCSTIQTRWNLTKQCENYCGIDNWSSIKLTMSRNQNCLKANKHFYSKLSCMKKYSYHSFSGEYKLFSFKLQNTVSLTFHSIILSYGPQQRYTQCTLW